VGVLQHGGDLEAAARVMNEARELDLQDRFINSKSAKYYIRNDKIDEAEKILGLFTRVCTLQSHLAYYCSLWVILIFFVFVPARCCFTAARSHRYAMHVAHFGRRR
jgi:hypothetical protein